MAEQRWTWHTRTRRNRTAPTRRTSRPAVGRARRRLRGPIRVRRWPRPAGWLALTVLAASATLTALAALTGAMVVRWWYTLGVVALALLLAALLRRRRRTTGPAGGSGPGGSAGVREPRRPLPTGGAGTAARPVGAAALRP